jgi:hypothetical protein
MNRLSDSPGVQVVWKGFSQALSPFGLSASPPAFTSVPALNAVPAAGYTGGVNGNSCNNGRWGGFMMLAVWGAQAQEKQENYASCRFFGIMLYRGMP